MQWLDLMVLAWYLILGACSDAGSRIWNELLNQIFRFGALPANPTTVIFLACPLTDFSGVSVRWLSAVL